MYENVCIIEVCMVESVSESLCLSALMNTCERIRVRVVCMSE